MTSELPSPKLLGQRHVVETTLGGLGHKPTLPMAR